MNKPNASPKSPHSSLWSAAFILAMVGVFELTATAPETLTLRSTASSQTNTSANLSSNIEHLVVVVQENHSFDSYFANYCQAPTGSNPSCVTGPACCEAGPKHEPGGALPILLNDRANLTYDPNHSTGCETAEIHGGKMDRFVRGSPCADRRNFAYANSSSAAYYWKLASEGALADRYFQPITGASSSNDMYLARAQFVFTDNLVAPKSIGADCGDVNSNQLSYTDLTIGDLLTLADVAWVFYAEGYDKAVAAHKHGGCMKPERGCLLGRNAYPCIFDPSDVPFAYYDSTVDRPDVMKDYEKFATALSAKQLPAISFVKALGFRTEHPGALISDGMGFVKAVVDAVETSSYAADTLVLVTHDESGGFFDHIAPPGMSPVDHKPYGPRIPMIAVGRFARKGRISHVQMEHSSIVKFIEWNWLGKSGQLHGRDAVVNNIGSLLDPASTGRPVPEGPSDLLPSEELPSPGAQPLND